MSEMPAGCKASKQIAEQTGRQPGRQTGKPAGRRGLDIKVKLAVFFIAAITISMLSQVIFNVFISKKVFLNQRQVQIEQLFDQLEANYSDDQQAIWDIVLEAQNVQNIRVLITSDHGVIYANPPFFDDRHSQEIRTEQPTVMVFDSPRDEKIINLTGTIHYRGEARYVTLTTSVQAIDESVALFTKTNIIISLGIMVLGGLGLLYVARNLSKPIQNIEVVARHVSELNFDTKADENVSTTEIALLAQSINTMAEKLEGMINDLSSANEQLKDKVDYQEKLDQMRKEFVANVSHEMKTPLSMLMMYSESLRSDIPGIDRDFYLDTIIEEAERLNDMVMQLLDISSLENGLEKIGLEPVDFSEFVNRATERTDMLLKGRAVSRSIEPGIRILGNEKYLERAIRNYITNASAHTEEGAKVRISLSRRGDRAVFAVFNEGEPIAQENMGRIWDSFYRADEARTQTEAHRVGLGLYIVKTIVQKHHGEFGAENRDGGVEFWFSVKSIQ